MSARGLNFLVEMFPHVDKTLLSEMCSNIQNDDEMDGVVASLLESLEEETRGSYGGEVPRVVTGVGSLPVDDFSQVGAPEQASSIWTEPPAEGDSHRCTTGKCSLTTAPRTVEYAGAGSCDFVYDLPPPPRNAAPLYDAQRWSAPQTLQQTDYVVQPGAIPDPLYRARMPYAYQAPAPQQFLQPFYTSPFHTYPPYVQGVPLCRPYLQDQPMGNCACKQSVPGESYWPEPVGGNKRTWFNFTGCTGDANRKHNFPPEGSLLTSPDESASRPSYTMPRMENGGGGQECLDRCESVSQEAVAGSVVSSESVIASHYLSLIAILPDSDPAFLRKKCEEINGSVSELQKYVIEALTLNNYEKNSSVSALKSKSVENKLSAVQVEDVVGNLPSKEASLGSSGVHAGGDEQSSISTQEEPTSESSIVNEVDTAPVALVSDELTKTEDASQPVCAALSDTSSDNTCTFEMVNSTDVIDELGDGDSPCTVSSEAEFELNVVKLNDVSSENESCQLLEVVVDQESEPVSPDSQVSEAAKMQVLEDHLLVGGDSGDASGKPYVQAKNVNIIYDRSVFVFGEASSDSDGESEGSFSTPGDRNSDGEAAAGLLECAGVDAERSPLQTEPAPPTDVSHQLDDDFPPELFEVDPASTADDYEIARLMSEEDKACGVFNDPLEEKMDLLLNFMPDADPSYLKDICERYGNDEVRLQTIVQECLDSNKYPTFEDYLETQEAMNLIRETLSQITIPMFVNLYTRPFEYFYGTRQKERSEVAHELGFLQRRYRNIADGDLVGVLDKCDHNLTMCCKELDSWDGATQHMRGDWECEVPADIDMSFIHEVFFIENERYIREHLELEMLRGTVLDRAKFMEARLECPICYDDELEFVQMAACAEGHLFCKECVKKSAETVIGYGLTKFPCLESSCNAEFGTRTLEALLSHVLFTRMVQQRSLEEVESAQIEDLVRCPFCEYAAILPPDLSVLICENPECLKETCRYCKEPNHIPLRCSEVEKEGETKMRTEIEDRMSDAFIRKCNSCGKKFIKSDGCNKMACPCGAIMCYLCRKTVTDYTHFNGMGGTEFHKCPLFTNDSMIHHEEVKTAAARAKAEVTARNPGLELKVDPTVLLPEV